MKRKVSEKYIVILACILVIAGIGFFVEPEAESESPYSSETIDYYIEYKVTEQTIGSEVETAMDWWTERGHEYIPYNFSYQRTENRDDADLIIEVVQSVENCEHERFEVLTGCADLVKDEAPDPVTVEIDIHQTSQLLVGTIKHELGHTLGKEHGDAPREVMNKRGKTVANRTQLYIHTKNVDNTDTSEIERALSYLSDLNGSELESYEFVTDRTDADIVISEVPEGQIPVGYVSEIEATELYGQSRLTFADSLETDRVGWHVASLLGQLLLDELPDTLDSDTPVDIRKGGWDQ